jgi:hypothetical protein
MLNDVYRQSINGFRFFRNDLAHRNTELSLFAAVFRLGSLQGYFNHAKDDIFQSDLNFP